MSWELTPGAGHSPGPEPAGHTPGYEGTNGGQNIYLLHVGPGSMLNKTSDMSDYRGPHILYNRNIGSDNCDIFQS